MDVRRKVLLDLLASPGTLLPIVGGLSTLIFSWAMDGGAAINFLGLAGILCGVGVLATRLVLGLENITERAYEYLHGQELRKQEEALDDLDERLRRDRDPRTQEGLRELRLLYGTFVADVNSGKITRNTHEILEIVEQLFRTSVNQLERSYRLWRAAGKLSGDSKQRKLQEREQVVEEVVKTIRHLGRTIAEFRSFTAEKNQENLGRLRKELDQAIRVARRTEERMAEWDPTTPTQTELE